MLTKKQKKAAEFVGRAIARSTREDHLSRKWTGLDPEDGDVLMRAGLRGGTKEWREAEEVARAVYISEFGPIGR